MNATLTQLDALREIFNIGVGRAASVLNATVGAHISLQIPDLKLVSPLEARRELSQYLGVDSVSAVRLGFSGSLNGIAHLVFPADSAFKLVNALIDESANSLEPDFDSLKIGALTEVGNIVLNSILGTVSNLLNQDFHYVLPNYVEGTVEQLLTYNDCNTDTTILVAQTRFLVEQFQVEGNIILLFKVGSFEALLTTLHQLYGEL